MTTFLNVLFFGLLAGLASFLGIFLIVKKEKWAQKNLIYLISFSAGVLLSLAFVHLLPEAVEFNKNALLWTLISFLAFYFLEHALSLHACEEDRECEVHQTFTLVTWSGLMLHSLIDGIIIGVGFEVSVTLGILSTIAVLLHRLPDGISAMAVMLYGGKTIKQATKYSTVIALITPVGAVLSYFIFQGASLNLVGALLAIAAGSFLYVAASELIPEIHKKSKILNIILSLIGASIPFLVEKLL